MWINTKILQAEIEEKMKHTVGAEHKTYQQVLDIISDLQIYELPPCDLCIQKDANSQNEPCLSYLS